ncbi:MAG TPA: type 4a pilus biogenesis protein PilO [Verrucomicrobiae bacterium]|jgi:Tfp pilus assembly protein PilO|nr:type 4a pilus biogenesis protein PilO [Verrucomicrobiae bacterium]
MNRLSKEKRSELILVALVVVGIIVGLWFGVIRSQKDDLRTLAAKKADDLSKLAQTADTIKNSERAKSELVIVSNQLAIAERDMPSGDLYLSMVNTIRKFNHDYDVQISQFNPTGGDTPENLLPRFPYRQVTVSISGMAHYHDLGKFIADFENNFPTSRVLNLDLSPASVTAPADKEKLSFKMDIVSLVASSGTRSASNP